MSSNDRVMKAVQEESASLVGGNVDAPSRQDSRASRRTPPPPSGSPPASGKSSSKQRDPAALSSSRRKSKKKKEVTVVTTILGARRQQDGGDGNDEEDEDSDDDEGDEDQSGLARTFQRSLAVTTAPTKERVHRTPESVQLLRPPTDNRDVTVEAINLLDTRFELNRDLGSIERALVPTNTVFRVVGALGSSGSGRSSTLTAVNTTTKVITDSVFERSSVGLDVLLNAQRRIFLVDFPPVCSPNVKRHLDPPVFATQYRDVTKLYDLRMAFTALVTCSVLFLCVTDEADASEPLFQLIKAASSIVHRRGWPTAKVVLVRNLVDSGQHNNQRRMQADERTLESSLGALSESAFGGVVHVPRRSPSDKEALSADREIARHALNSFASRSTKLPVPSKILSRATESEWLSSLAFVMNETRTHPFFAAGEDTKWFR